MTKTIINKHAGTCADCGLRVAPGAGTAEKDFAQGRAGERSMWIVRHSACEASATPTPAPAAKPLEERPSFPLTDEQQAAVELFAQGQSIAIQAGAGCLAADTVININRGGKGFRATIEHVAHQVAGTATMNRELYGKQITQGARGWDPAIDTMVARAEGDVVRLGQMSTAWASGVKETFTLRTTAGRTIRATAKHPFLTPAGFATLGDLRIGDLVMVNTGRSTKGRTVPKPSYRMRETRFHPSQVVRSIPRQRFGVAEHRLIVEADMNGLSLDDYLIILRQDPDAAKSIVYLTANDHVHHENHDTADNALSNLVVMTEAEHHRHHAVEGGKVDAVLHQVGTERVETIEAHGDEMTYDIEMSDDPHNFLANGFVVHNTGKTSTLVAIAKSTTRTGRYVAFNKAIVQDASAKLPRNVSASTAHSIAYQQVGKHYRHRLDSQRQSSDEIARRLGIEPIYLQMGEQRKVLQPRQLAGYVMKAIATFCNSADELPSGRHMPYIEGIDQPTADFKRTYKNNDHVRKEMSGAIATAWDDICHVDGSLRFSPDCYLKIWQLGLRGKPVIPGEFILFDEAQDASPVLLAAVEAQDKQVVFVGDAQQQIYEWRGAVDAMSTVPAESTCYLTNSFRFGEEIAEAANKVLGHIPSAELRLTGRGKPGQVAPSATPQAVLCRTNAGSITVVLDEMEAGRTAFLVGGGSEVARFARAARDLMAGRRTDHPELCIFENWNQAKEYAELDVLGSEIAPLVQLIDKHGVELVLRAAGGECSEEDADVVVSTAHKAKGREWDTVQLHDDFPPLHRMEDGEYRLLYVALTRARTHLDIERCTAAIEAVFPGRAVARQDLDGEGVDLRRSSAPARRVAGDMEAPAASSSSVDQGDAPSAARKIAKHHPDWTEQDVLDTVRGRGYEADLRMLRTWLVPAQEVPV